MPKIVDSRFDRVSHIIFGVDVVIFLEKNNEVWIMKLQGGCEENPTINVFAIQNSLPGGLLEYNQPRLSQRKFKLKLDNLNIHFRCPAL